MGKSKSKKAAKNRNLATKQYVKSTIARNKETFEKRIAYSSLTNYSGFSYGSGCSYNTFYSALTTGATQDDRVGQVLKAAGVKVRLALQPGDQHNMIRLIFLTTKRYGTNESFSDPTSFVQNVFSGESSSATQYLAPIDTARWKVLYDKTMLLRFVPTDGATSGTYPLTRVVKKFIPFKRRIVFDDEEQAPRNDLYMIAISDSAVASHPKFVAGHITIMWKDI